MYCKEKGIEEEGGEMERSRRVVGESSQEMSHSEMVRRMIT